MQHQLDSLIRDYTKFSTFTETAESLSENYLLGFSGLFSSSEATIFYDLSTDKSSIVSVSISNYVDTVKKHFPIGLDIQSVKLLYFSIEENTDKSTKKQMPFFMIARIEKAATGYWDYIRYLDHSKSPLILDFLIPIDANFNLTKIKSIKPNVKYTQRILEQSIGPIATRKQELETELSDIQTRMNALKMEYEKVKSEYEKIQGDLNKSKQAIETERTLQEQFDNNSTPK